MKPRLMQTFTPVRFATLALMPAIAVTGLAAESDHDHRAPDVPPAITVQDD